MYLFHYPKGYEVLLTMTEVPLALVMGVPSTLLKDVKISRGTLY